MNQTEMLLNLFKYFTKFVSKEVLQKMLSISASSQRQGYGQIESEILNTSDKDVIETLSAYVFSMNEKFVSDKIRNNKEMVLYVEFGAISYNPQIALGTKQNLAIYVAYPYNIANNDNLNEILIMDQTQQILFQILNNMQKDQSQLDFCGDRELIKFPAEIIPIEPMTFYDHIGWMGVFDYSQTNLI